LSHLTCKVPLEPEIAEHFCEAFKDKVRGRLQKRALGYFKDMHAVGKLGWTGRASREQVVSGLANHIWHSHLGICSPEFMVLKENTLNEIWLRIYFGQ
jgi:hypothetical protein